MARYSRAAWTAVALITVTPLLARAQATPKATLSVGFGNAYGWIGGQVEGYLARGRVSGFAGAGYVPNVIGDGGDGFAGAFWLRAFTSGTRHRGLLEVSYSVLSVSTSSTFGGDVLDESRNYGPGVAAGYRFTSDGGLTLTFSAGVGIDDDELDLESEGTSAQPTLGIGVGYTVR